SELRAARWLFEPKIGGAGLVLKAEERAAVTAADICGAAAALPDLDGCEDRGLSLQLREGWD
ncbi:unnamed protein product, partial [Nesidiocoris tenuis]